MMINPAVFNILGNAGAYKVDGFLRRKTGTNKFGRGEIQFGDPEPIAFFTVPDNSQKFNPAPDKAHVIVDDRHFWFDCKLTGIAVQDILIFDDGVPYELNQVEPRPQGNFIYAHGQRRPDAGQFA